MGPDQESNNIGATAPEAADSCRMLHNKHRRRQLSAALCGLLRSSPGGWPPNKRLRRAPEALFGG
eukprot:10958217-Alexandrium_andersonii.AAC.1